MTITLISGRVVDSANLFFNADTYHFTLSPSGEDITDDIKRADKLAIVPGFDITLDNSRLYREGPTIPQYTDSGTGPIAPLNDSTASIFVDQLTSDPLGAPLAALNKGIDKLIAAPAITKIGIAAVVILVIYFAVKKK